MLYSNDETIIFKFKQYQFELHQDIYLYKVSNEQSLSLVYELLKDKKKVGVMLSGKFVNNLRELYLLGSFYVEKNQGDDYFINTALVSSGLMLPLNLGSMPFEQEVSMSLLHPVIRVESDHITILKRSKVSSFDLNNSFWNDKVIHKISEEEKTIKIYFYLNVNKLTKRNKEPEKRVSDDKILIYSKFLNCKLNQLATSSAEVSNSIENFFEKLNIHKYDFVIYESENKKSENLHKAISSKIKQLQKECQVVLLSDQNISPDYLPLSVENINQHLIKFSKNYHYSLGNLSSWIYSKESFKICRINPNHLIISSDKNLSEESILLCNASNSLIKIYKNKFIRNKYYYWAHLEHINEENRKKFVEFLDKNSKIHYN